MDKIKLMKWIFFFTIIFGLISCFRETKSNEKIEKSSKKDTIIVKHKHELNKSYQIGFYSKSYSYYRLVNKDTLDFVVNVTEYEKDSTLSLNIYHKEPIVFKSALKKINECYSLINEDFHLSKLNSFYFRAPIYYLDLSKELSTEYEKLFGRKNINYTKLNEFILNSEVNKQLNLFLNPLHKKVKQYSIEKFHLTEKKYYSEYLPNVDLTEYPEFIINGMGISVQLENKPNR